MPNIGPDLNAWSMRAIASPPVISFACAISNSPSVPWLAPTCILRFPSRGRGREAMTYRRVLYDINLPCAARRGCKSFGRAGEGPLRSSHASRPPHPPIVPEARLRHDGPPSPQGEGLAAPLMGGPPPTVNARRGVRPVLPKAGTRNGSDTIVRHHCTAPSRSLS